MTRAELQAAVVAEALSWVGTPYHHCADIKGAGVDCAMLLVRVYATCGLIPASVDPRPYAFDWHLHRGEEQFIGWLAQYAVEVPTLGPAQAADVQVWRYGRCFSHGGICLGDGRVVHALRREATVTIAQASSAELASHPVKRFRLQGLLQLEATP